MSQSSTIVPGLGLMMALVSGCSGSGAVPTSPTTPVTTAPAAGAPAPSPSTTVITVSAAGVSPQVLTIPVGARVTFTNADNRAHDFAGGPDPNRPECPEIDGAGFVAPGQSKQTGVFGVARTCQYHDHAYLGVAAFTGRIVIQ